MKQVFQSGVAGLVLICGAFAMASCNEQGHASDLAPVSLVDQADNPVRKCMNMGNALEADTEGEWGYVIKDEHIRAVKEAGFDTIRVPIKWSARAQLQAPYHIDADFMARVDHIVMTAINEGLQVILDVHHYDDLMKDPIQDAARLEAIWDQIARHYAQVSDKLIFEIVNEPYGEMTKRRLASLNNSIMDKIRAYSPDRWVVLAGVQWGNFEGLEGMIFSDDPRTIVTFHYYSPFEFTHQGASWTAKPYPVGREWGNEDDLKAFAKDMDAVRASSLYKSRYLFLGEFGAIYKAPLSERAEYTRNVREAAEELGIGWCYWDFGTSFKAYDLKTESWIPEIKSALFSN